MATRNISGKLLRHFITGVLYRYYRDSGTIIKDDNLDYYIDDTCTKLHKYMTNGFSAGGDWSDIQCTIALDVCELLDIKLFDVLPGDTITIY